MPARKKLWVVAHLKCVVCQAGFTSTLSLADYRRRIKEHDIPLCRACYTMNEVIGVRMIVDQGSWRH